MENQEQQEKWLDAIEEIQQALEPLKWEVVGFDMPYNNLVTIKICRIFK